MRRKRGLPRGSVLEFTDAHLTHVIYKHQGDKYTLLKVDRDKDPPGSVVVDQGITFAKAEEFMQESDEDVRYMIIDKRVKFSAVGDLSFLSTEAAAERIDGARLLETKRKERPAQTPSDMVPDEEEKKPKTTHDEAEDTAAPVEEAGGEEEKMDEGAAESVEETGGEEEKAADTEQAQAQAVDGDESAKGKVAGEEAAEVSATVDPPPQPETTGQPISPLDKAKLTLERLVRTRIDAVDNWALDGAQPGAEPKMDGLDTQIERMRKMVDQLTAEAAKNVEEAVKAAAGLKRKADEEARQQQEDTAKAEAKRMKEAGATDDMETAVEADGNQRANDLKNQQEQTDEQLAAHETFSESATAKLSEGQVGSGTTTQNAPTGASSGMEVADVMDKDVAMVHEGSGDQADRPMHPENANPTDKVNGEVTKGADTGDVVKMDIDRGHNKDTTSANAMAAKRKDVNMSDAERNKRDRARAKAQEAEAKAAAKAQETFDKGAPTEAESMDTSLPPSLKEITESGQINAGVARVMARLHSADVDLADEKGSVVKYQALVRQEVTAALHQLARQVDPQRMEAPSVAQQIKGAASLAVNEMAGRGEAGSFPIYSPNDALAKATGMGSSELTTMTIKEQNQLLDELKPWWNEYRTVRTNQGFVEMEAMPTYLITSPIGTVQAGSKVRTDMDQPTNQFFYFMYWAMRAKMDNMYDHLAWRDLFRYSAAMGYNDLTKGQINWLVTGNVNGTFDESIDFDGIPAEFNEAHIAEGEITRTSPLIKFNQAEIDILHRAVSGMPLPNNVPPGKNTSPSPEGRGTRREMRVVDGRLVSVTASFGRFGDVGAETLEGIPNKVSNIPDPRFSERGGQQVKNVRVVTVKNPDYKPEDPDSKEFLHKSDGPSKNTDDRFLQKEIADVGAGSKDVNHAIEKAEADRLTAALPFKLYAPLHPQACDRYLGERNYARLGLEPAKYFKSYVKQPFDVTQVDQQYNWNQFVMLTYGPMLYAFVTDAALQRTSPIFDLNTPMAVTLEFMELNELIEELKRYQMKSADRADRVGDSGAAQSPIEEHLDNFFKSRDQETAEKFADSNAVVIALPEGDPNAPPDDPSDPSDPDDPSGDDPVPPPRPGGDPDDPPALVRSQTGFLPMASTSGFKVDKPPVSVTQAARDIDQGIRRKRKTHGSVAYGAESHAAPVKVDRHTKMFRLLNGGKSRR